MNGRPSEKPRRKKWKILLITVLSAAVCAGLALSALSIYGKYQMSKIPALSFLEALEYTTRGKADAVITVGIIQNGAASYTVYGENGKELPRELHTYEIGSLTKTFTAAMVSKAVAEGKMDLDATLDQYLSLPEGNVYPTIKELLTHTSGYKGYYFETPMISNFLTGKNSFYGVTKAMVAQKAGQLSMPGEHYPFNYSNYGYAVLGLALEEVYGVDYAAVMEQFISDLGLTHTQFPSQSGDLGNNWDWDEKDAYLSAGGLTSDIHDMLAYAQLQLEEAGYWGDSHRSLKEINASTEQYQTMGIRLDEIGMAWIIDRENHIIWHNGGTGHYNCYLGFDPETEAAVVVLSNLPPNDRIPATVLGIKRWNELRQNG